MIDRRMFDLGCSSQRGVLQSRIHCEENSHMYLMAIFLLSGKAILYCSINDQAVTFNYDTTAILTLTNQIQYFHLNISTN